jgi:hypothetical protein
MATLFHNPMTDRPAGQDAGMGARVAFAAAFTVKDETVAPVGRRAR